MPLRVPALVAACLLAACSATDEPTGIEIESSRYAVSLPPTSEVVLTATVTGTALDAPVTWTSSAPGVATIRDDGPWGIVTGVAEGTTTVYAVLASNHNVKSPPVTVTVARVPALTAFAVDTAVQQMIVGDAGRTFSLNPVRFAPRATVTYSFSSNNNAVATVNTTTGALTAVAPGNTSITVTATASGAGLITNTLTATAQVMVGVIQLRSPHITAGSSQTCALKLTGQAFCWGWNAFGQLGDGTFTDHFTPAAVAGNLNFLEISSSYNHTCAITLANVAYCWGNGSVGRLGTGDTVTRSTPTPVSNASPYVAIETGGSHTCALSQAGAASCWGWNMSGQLGDLTQIDRFTPVAIKLSGVALTTLAGGLNDTCAITVAGSAYCWNNPPVVQDGGAVFATIGAGRQMKCALSTRGQLACWGSGPLQTLASQPSAGSPRAFIIGYTFRLISIGDDFGCALTVANDAYCWGAAVDGELGSPGANNGGVLNAVSGGLKFVELAAGEKHACGITTTNQVYCWGSNSKGQLGSTGARSLVPQLVPLTR